MSRNRGQISRQDVKDFMRGNPQVVVLLAICLVLGIGTFIAVLIAVAGSGSGQGTGDPDGASIRLLHAALTMARALAL